MTSSKQTWGSQSRGIRQRNNQRSTTIVKTTKNETVKLSDIKVKKPRLPVVPKTHVISENKRNRMKDINNFLQANKTQKTRIKMGGGTKRKLSITKEHNKKKKGYPNVRKNSKSIPGKVFRLKSI